MKLKFCSTLVSCISRGIQEILIIINDNSVSRFRIICEGEKNYFRVTYSQKARQADLRASAHDNL